MITKNHFLLTASEEQIKVLVRFEAIKLVHYPEYTDIHNVWACNKTPVCLESECKDSFSSTLQVPQIDIKTKFRHWAFTMGFEPGEYISGLKYDTRTETCVLCSICNHQGLSRSSIVYNQHVEREVDCIIYESDNFYVTSEYGALLPGYLMIVPKEHEYFSVAQYPKSLLPEYLEVCEDVEEMLKKTFDVVYVIFFEHGSSSSGMSSHEKSIVHAHTHVLAGYTIGFNYLNSVKAHPRSDYHITDIDGAYFSYKEGAHGQLWVADDPDVYIQRQYPRQIIAQELGLTPGQYNWRRHAFSENTHVTLYKLYRYLDSGRASDRIVNRCDCFIKGYPLRDDFSDDY